MLPNADLPTIITSAFEAKLENSHWHPDDTVLQAILSTLGGLDNGSLRIAEKTTGGWQVNTWLKQAILLYFSIQQSQPMAGEHTQYHDKIPPKFAHLDADTWASLKVRVAPPAMARYGAYIGPNTVMMPSYVNVGAYVDSGCMLDTWSTVGSCAQIGKNVHISGGAGIGGVLEPLQAQPTIIEDDCFIGARSEIVEGVVVETGAVIGMGVFISQSTKIYNRATGEISYGRVPAGAVVVPGSLPAKDGSHALNCAVIVKAVDAKTRSKVGINALLRDLN